MEAVQDTFLEAAIGWLVQTILESLSTGKLEAWIRGVELADDVERLKSEIERVEMVVAAVKGWAIGNKLLARSLVRLKELLYDADDAADELDYYRLQQQVEGALAYPESADGHGAEQVERPRGNADIPSSSGGKKRSKAWGHFNITEEENGKPVKAKCIHCHKEVRCGSDKGTSVLHNHLKSDSCKKKRGASDQQPNTCSVADGTANGTPAATSDLSSRKRRRMNEESTHSTAANAHHWNEAEFSCRIKEITRQLHDIRGAVSEVLKLHGSDSVASTNQYRRTRSGVCPRTSSLIQRKIYGRVAEKNSIIKMIATDEYDGITVLPIVGIGGVGKTALAHLVYDDPTVKSQFRRIWIWVSDNFDEMKLTREMLDFVSQDRHEGSSHKKERHEGISSFAKLQEILKGHMESQSKKFLLILDDVWDNMDDYRWNKLLAPLKSSHAKGNVILVTTRILSVAQRIGTVEPIKLGALADEDFWLLFKACAFGDENYDGHVGLSTIGRQIADRLQGNPLAAETAGALLREHLNIDHWSNILKNEDWKSLQLSRGIMPALKFSYDKLPYHLQRCFSYCSIFPNNYQFLSKELIRIWIAQGYVNDGHSGKRLEEIEQDYLFGLVNSGFFQQDERKRSSLGNQTCYVMSGLMHDFAMVVSRTECATIDGLRCNEMFSTVRHLSIVTDSAYTKDRHGNILRNEEFEKKLLDVVTSVRKLRTLVLIGQCNPSFLQWFQKLFKEAHNLRVLQISTKWAGFNSFLCNVANPSHLRYLKLEDGEEDGALPEVLSKFYHLQVLVVGSDTKLTISNGVNNLVSLRHLVAVEDVYSSIANIGKMTSLQELHNFSVRNSSGFEITQLQSMNKLVLLGVSQLENVKTREEAYEAGLSNKKHLGKLHLSWNDTLSQDEYDNDMSSEFSIDIEEEDESSPMDDIGPSSEPSRDTAREVLEGLEPHHNLKHLRISEYDGATSPAWLANSLTSLRTLHLECCGKLQIIPSLQRLPFLRKFVLRNMLNVTEVSIPSLEELVLIKMPKLERCSCTSLRDLSSSLRVLKVRGCPVLKVFPLFEDCQKFKIEQKSWLSSLGELIIHKCPQLLVPHPLPPSTSVSKLSICRVSTLPSMEGSSSGTLTIGVPEYSDPEECIDEHSDELTTLDGKMLSFHNLRFLTHLRIAGCRNLTSISFEGLRQLISLKSLEIYNCRELFSSHVLPEYTHEDMAAANCNTRPSLERLHIHSCGVTGKWLSLMLRHVQALEELDLEDCEGIAWLSVEEEEENSLSNLISSPDYSSSTSSVPDGLLCIPLNLISSLKKISIEGCRDRDLTSYASKGVFAGFTSLEELTICYCPELLPSLVHKDGNDDQANGRWLLPQSLVQLYINYSPETLQPCFPGNLTCLKRLQVSNSPGLKSLQLHSCTALEQLEISGCKSLASLEGLQSLWNLKALNVSNNGSLKFLQLHSCTALKGCGSLATLEGPQSLGGLRHLKVSASHTLEFLQLHSCTALEELTIRDCGSLTALEGLQSLGNLKALKVSGNRSLKFLQLHSCVALEELTIEGCGSLAALEGLQSLGNLKALKVSGNGSLKFLQLHSCTALEELTIERCVSLAALEGPQSLGNLKALKVYWSPSLKSLQLYSCTSLEELAIINCGSLAALEGLQTLGNLKALKVSGNESLKFLQLHSCAALEELTIEGCGSLAALEGPQSLGNLKALKVYWSPSLKSLQLYSCTSLEELAIINCGLLAALEGLQFLGNLKALEVSGNRSLKSLQLDFCTALEELAIINCGLLAALEGLQFLGNLKALEVSGNRSLKSLQLDFCTALEELTIEQCGSLAALEGLQSLGGLRRLVVYGCPGLRLSRQVYELCPRLERLEMDEPSALTASFCKHLTSLLSLRVRFPIGSRDVISRLTHEQEEALQHITSLQELRLQLFKDLIDLPTGLHSLRSLKRLEIHGCPGISSLPEKGLPPSLEQLDISGCSKELNEHCRMFATSKLKVKTNGEYAN